jgi:hypothetical protein
MGSTTLARRFTPTLPQAAELAPPYGWPIPLTPFALVDNPALPGIIHRPCVEGWRRSCA